MSDILYFTYIRVRKILSSLWNKFNSVTLTIILILGAVIILGFLIYREREILLTYNWHFRLGPLLISFVLFTLDLFMVAAVWGWIMNKLGKNLSYIKHFCYFTLSNVTKRIPGTIWYIASRTQFYRREGIDPKLSALASGMEMAVSIISSIFVVIIFSIPIALFYEVDPFLILIPFVLSLVLIHPRFMEWVFRLLKVEADPFNYKDILQWLVAYVFIWVLGGVLMFMIGNSITSISIGNLPYIIGSFGLVNLVTVLVFFLPSNLGITEIGWSILLSNILPVSIAVVLAILIRLLVITYELIWAGISYSILTRINTNI